MILLHIIQENINSEDLFGLVSGNLDVTGDIEITQSDSSSATGIDTDGALKARNITITQKNIQNNASDAYDSARYLLGINGTGSSNGDLIGSIEADTIRITQDTFGTKAPVINPAVVVDPSGIYIDKIKAKQITIYQDAKPQAPYRAANEAYGIRTNTSEIENAHITQLPLITGGTFYALYGGQYNNVTIVSEDNVVLGRYGDISITGTADITLINGAYLSTGTYSNIFINNAVVNRQCSELYPSSKPDNITINNLTDNYTPCE